MWPNPLKSMDEIIKVHKLEKSEHLQKNIVKHLRGMVKKYKQEQAVSWTHPMRYLLFPITMSYGISLVAMDFPQYMTESMYSWMIFFLGMAAGIGFSILVYRIKTK